MVERSDNPGLAILYDGDRVGDFTLEYYREHGDKLVKFLIQEDRPDLLHQLGVDLTPSLPYRAMKYGAVAMLRSFSWLPRTIFFMRKWEVPVGSDRFGRVVDLALDRGALPSPVAIENAAHRGHLDIVKRLVEAGGFPTTDALYQAAVGGHRGVVSYLLERGVPITPSNLNSIINHGDERVAEFLIQIAARAQAEGRAGILLDKSAVKEAARAGRGQLLDQLLKYVKVDDGELLMHVAHGGLVNHVRKILARNESLNHVEQALMDAVGAGHLTVVQLLYEWLSRRESSLNYLLQRALERATWANRQGVIDYLLGLVPNTINAAQAMNNAIMNGNYPVAVAIQRRFQIQNLPQTYVRRLNVQDVPLPLVQFMHDQLGMTFSSEVMDQLAPNSHPDVVRYLHEELGVPFGEHTLDEAYAEENWPLVEYLLSQGATFTTEAITRAIWYKRSHLVPELLAAGAPFDHMVIKVAIKWGRVDVLKQMAQHGATYGPDDLARAISKGRFKVVKYLIDLGVEYNPSKVKFTPWVPRGGLLDIIGFLYDNRLPFDEEGALTAAVRGDNVPVLELLREHGVQFPPTILEKAHRSVDVDTVIYLIRVLGAIPADALEWAVIIGNVDLVRYLLGVGVRPTEEAARLAVGNRYQNIIHLLRQHGVDFGPYLSRAIYNGMYPEVVAMIRAGVMPRWTELTRAIVAAKERDDDQVVQLLEEQLRA